jgi:hypothetical protein
MSSIIKLIATPLGDDDIRNILGSETKVIRYSELSKFNNLGELLPNEKDYCIVLYEHEALSGHWVCLLKYNNAYEFFDAYGLKVDRELKWTDLKTRQQLNEDIPYLSNLLEKEQYIYNGFDFQDDDNKVETCGHHCCFRIFCFQNFGMDLNQYIDTMKFLKNKLQHSYDYIVAEFVYKQLR